MKKVAFFVPLFFVLFAAVTGCTSSRYRAEKYVSAVFLANDRQPFADADAETLLDTLWLFFSDASFEQYAIYPDGSIRQFLAGTYILAGEAAADSDFPADRKIELTVNNEPRTFVISEQFGTKIFEKKAGTKHLLSLFIGNDLQPYPAGDGEEKFLDTVWLYYSDTTFDQYAILPDGRVTQFSTGLYKLSDKKERVLLSGKEFTLVRTKKYKWNEGLVPYHSVHVYESEPVGYVLLYAMTAVQTSGTH